MVTRLKVTCTRVAQLKLPGYYTKDSTSRLAELEFSPVTGGSPENESFFNSTPTGKVEFRSVTPGIADAFEPGKSYYVDITEATA